MKNHFYGINRTANMSLSSVSEDRNILSFNNTKLQRQMSLGIGQSSVANRNNVIVREVDPALKGTAEFNKQVAKNVRMLDEMTGGKASATPEVLNALASGKAFDAQIQLNAPDRRNLAITGLATLIQLGAALATGGNSGFNKEQADVLTGRASADAEFVTKYGNAYDRGFFGIGAQYQDATLVLIPRERAELNEQVKKVDAGIAATAMNNNIRTSEANQKDDPKSSDIETVQSANAYDGNLSVRNQQATNIDTTAGGTIENNAYQRLGETYLKNLTPQQLRQANLSQDELDNINSRVSSGQRLDASQRAKLSAIGFSIGQDNGGRGGVVTSIIATEANLTAGATRRDPAGGVRGDLARKATADYLNVAGASGLLTQAEQQQLGQLLQNGIQRGDGQTLSNLLGKVEGRINSNQYADGTRIGDSDLSNFKKDRLLGGQHITELQYVANERIKLNTDAADQIDNAVNSRPGNISDATAKIFNDANGTNLTAAQLQSQLANRNLSGVNNALTTITGNINTVRSALTGTSAVAGGLYGTRNDILGNTLAKTDGRDNTLNPSEKDFFTGVQSLRDLITYRQAGGRGDASVGGVNVSTNGNIAERANALRSGFSTGTINSADQERISGELAGSFANQLKANGINASQPDVQDIVAAVAKGDTSSLSTAQASILARGTAASATNQSLRDNFMALVNLQKARTNPTASSSNITLTIGEGTQSQTTSGTVASQAQRLTNSLTGKNMDAGSEASIRTAFTDNLKSSSLVSGFSNDEIGSLAQKIATGETAISTLEGRDLELYNKIKGDTSLVSNFSAVGTAFNAIDSNQARASIVSASGTIASNSANTDNARAGNEIGAVGALTEATASSSTTTLPTQAGNTAPAQQTAKKDDLYKKYEGTPLAELNRRTEQKEKNNDFEDEKIKPQNQLQAFAQTISGLLDQQIITGSDGRKQTLSDAIVMTLLAIADEILRKSKASYSYGFADSAGISTSLYNDSNNKTVLQDIYASTKAVGVGVQNGIKQSDKYLRRRNNEEEAKGENISLRDLTEKLSKPEAKTVTPEEEAARLEAIRKLTQQDPQTIIDLPDIDRAIFPDPNRPEPILTA